MTQRKKLPIGIQTFQEIRDGGYYYVDKSGLAVELAENAKHYYLSRPRRFGKSLFLDTLKELFEGNEKLFKGLAAETQWDWSVKYPVLRFSFGPGDYSRPGYLQQNLTTQLDGLDHQFQHQSPYDSCSGRFQALIRHINEATGQRVVVLVDGYDKPVLDTLHAPDAAIANRDFLAGFFSTLKDYDAYVEFSFLTGVCKLAAASIFSGLNHLYDITLDRRYSTLCGYTDSDIGTVFAAELEGLDREEIRDWYNGYHWLGKGVYNPFDILQLFKRRVFSNYWFETGTPTLLVNSLFEHKIPTLRLDQMISSSSMLSSFEVERINLQTLLFQMGYLAIKKEENLGGQYFYTLGYPNREVAQSLNEQLLSALVKDKSQQATNSTQLYQLLMANDFDGLKQLFQSFFASIPRHWYTHNDIQNFEGYYASVFYSYFASLGLKITLEDITNLGRIDMTLHFNEQIYIFEFKVVELVPEGKALQQIKDKGYADKYAASGQPVYLIGVEFSKDNRNVVGFEIEAS